jgi:hypothetical protein
MEKYFAVVTKRNPNRLVLINSQIPIFYVKDIAIEYSDAINKGVDILNKKQTKVIEVKYSEVKKILKNCTEIKLNEKDKRFRKNVNHCSYTDLMTKY